LRLTRGLYGKAPGAGGTSPGGGASTVGPQNRFPVPERLITQKDMNEVLNFWGHQ
jgi:hypothetical protein